MVWLCGLCVCVCVCVCVLKEKMIQEGGNDLLSNTASG